MLFSIVAIPAFLIRNLAIIGLFRLMLSMFQHIGTVVNFCLLNPLDIIHEDLIPSDAKY